MNEALCMIVGMLTFAFIVWSQEQLNKSVDKDFAQMDADMCHECVSFYCEHCTWQNEEK